MVSNDQEEKTIRGRSQLNSVTKGVFRKPSRDHCNLCRNRSRPNVDNGLRFCQSTADITAGDKARQLNYHPLTVKLSSMSSDTKLSNSKYEINNYKK